MTTIPLGPLSRSPPRGGLARVGNALRRHRRPILALQWVIVAFYGVLVVVPALLPLPQSGASIVSDLTLFAQFAFWGIWWPFIASTMLLGRAWCGLFCPEGTLTEFASRHGLGKAIPRWMRWSGWPFVAFALTTVYGQLVSVYEYPKAVLLVLGGSTLAAVTVGFVYGKGKRVWCRHLCPVNGVFELHRFLPRRVRAAFRRLDARRMIGAARLAGGTRFDWKTLAMALVPIGGVGLFLGLSMVTLTQLRAEHIAIAHVDALRAALLAIGLGWSAWLGARIVFSGNAPHGARAGAFVLYTVPLVLAGCNWYFVLWRW